MRPTTSDTAAAVRRLLHVGCGPRRQDRLPACFRSAAWREIRLDIDQDVAPDIVASIDDLGMIDDLSLDAIYSSHNLEHLEGFAVARALAEFRRVLRADGFALITLPDLRAVARHIVEDRLDRPLYQSGAGPITPLDIVFGHQRALAEGRRHMAHRTGFTATTLGRALVDAGFYEVRVHEGDAWDLWALATLPATDARIVDQLAGVLA